MITLALLLAAQVNAVAPRDVADKWIAIAHSLDEGAPAPVMPVVEGAKWQRLRSLSFKNLMPCYDVVIGGAFDSKDKAQALVKKMRAAGINAYAKQSGKFVGEPPALVAHCARKKELLKSGGKSDGSCGALSFVEEHGKQRLFARTDISDDAALAQAKNEKPVDDDKSAWSAPLPAAAKVGVWTKGYALDVYDVANGKALGACNVERLVSLTRGEPHFGYFQSEEPPKGPGCGTPEIFAELSCKAGSVPSDVRLALPAGHRPPRLFTPQSTPVVDDTVRKALVAHVMTMPAAQTVKAQAEADAAAEKQKLDETLEALRFTSEGRSVLGVTLTWSTGEANPCSGDIIRSVMAVVDERAGNKFTTAVPAWETSSTLGVRAVYDLEGDGKLEVVERDLSTTILRKSDASELCSDVVPFCDCGC
jgi:hypothetical protein